MDWDHSRSRSRWLAAPTTVLFFGLVCVAAFAWGSFHSVDLLAAAEVRDWPELSRLDLDSAGPGHCGSTTPGKHFVADNRGYVCHWKDTVNGCCTNVREEERYSCAFCDETAQCCLVYEYCVACCLGPDNNNLIISMMLSTADPILQAANTQFDFCQAKCRTSSQSVVDHKQYKSEHKFCYGPSVPSSDAGEGVLEYVELPATSEAVAIRGQAPVLVGEGSGYAPAPAAVGRPAVHDPLFQEQQRRDEIYGQALLPQFGDGQLGSRPHSPGKLDDQAVQLVQHGREKLKPVEQSEYETMTFVDGLSAGAQHINFGNVAWDMDSIFTSAGSRFAGLASLPATLLAIVLAPLAVWLLA